jgi:hypothetical protein
MLVFYNVYFRSHYYFPSPRFVKRKRQIRVIGCCVLRSNIRHDRRTSRFELRFQESPAFFRW